MHYDLEGNFIEEVITGLGMPTSVAIQGDYVSVPDLKGRVVILDKSNTIMAVLGFNPDPEEGRQLQDSAGGMDRRCFQRHAWILLGC